MAATTVVKKNDPKAAKDIFLGDVAIQSTFKAQSKFNAMAAGVMGVAAAAGVLAQMISN